MNYIETRHPRERRIAVGVDSKVYKYGEFVIKQYPRLDFATLLAYQQMTNYMAYSLQDIPLQSSAIIEGFLWNVRFLVNPILELYPEPIPQARSLYIPGPDGFRMLEHTNRGLEKIKDLRGLEEQEFFLRQLELLKDIGYRDFMARITDPTELVKRVGEETGVQNLTFIDRINTKWRANTTERELNIHVTDLGSRISCLTFRPVVRNGEIV